MIKHIFFDLDGTLTDSAEGIVGTVKFMLSELGLPVPEDNLRWVVGPPFEESVAKLIGSSDPEKVKEAVGIYRAKFVKEGLYQNKPYSGVEEILKQLSQDFTLFVATSKPTPQAKTILKHFGLDHYFKEIYGSGEHGERPEKSLILKLALEEHQLQANTCLMIGDRKHDVEGARANGIETISVSYGYGSEIEFKESRAIANSPAEILKKIPELTSGLTT